MTRIFLEIKNITLFAEPSFFILQYFLCKNLLFLCAEHPYLGQNLKAMKNFICVYSSTGP
jgi:hypothetical protein